MSNIPEKIVVEVVTPEVVARLESRDEALRAELKSLEGRMEGLHRTVYELIEAIGNLRKK